MPKKPKKSKKSKPKIKQKKAAKKQKEPVKKEILEKEVFLAEVIKKIVGKNTEAILPILIGKKNINEFHIADKLKLTINQTRNILYKLHAFDIVSFTRKKDKRKGWYIYFWTLNELKSLNALKKIRAQEIDEMNKLLQSRIQKQFYFCPEDNIELNEETAMHHEFLCPECGRLLDLADNEKRIREISGRIDFLKREMAKLDFQVDILTPKQIVKKERVKKVKKKKAKPKKKAKKKAKPKKKKTKKSKAKKKKTPKKKIKSKKKKT